MSKDKLGSEYEEWLDSLPNTWGNILCLDYAATTGWAVYKEGKGVTSGIWKLKGETIDEKFYEYFYEVKNMILGGIDLVYHEKAGGFFRHAASGRANAGYAAILRVLCVRYGIELKEIHPMTLKSRAKDYLISKDIPLECLKAKKPKKLPIKADMINAAEHRFNRKVKDDNEADALCILEYALKEIADE